MAVPACALSAKYFILEVFTKNAVDSTVNQMTGYSKGHRSCAIDLISPLLCAAIDYANPCYDLRFSLLLM